MWQSACDSMCCVVTVCVQVRPSGEGADAHSGRATARRGRPVRGRESRREEEQVRRRERLDPAASRQDHRTRARRDTEAALRRALHPIHSTPHTLPFFHSTLASHRGSGSVSGQLHTIFSFIIT